MHDLAKRITNHLIYRKIILEADADIYAYGFECSLSNAIELTAIFAIGWVMGIQIELFVFLFCFSSIKKWTGGWHAKTHLACFVLSTAASILSLLAIGFLPSWACFVLLVVSGIIVILFAPIAHPNNPKTTDQLLLGRKRVLRSLAMIYLGIIAAYLLQFEILALSASSGVFLSSATLIPAMLGEEVKTWKGRRNLILHSKHSQSTV